MKWVLLFSFVVLWHTTFLASWILDLSPNITGIDYVKKYVVSLLMYCGIPLATLRVPMFVSWFSVPFLIISSCVVLLFNDWDLDGVVVWVLLTNLGSLILLVYSYLPETNKA